MFSTYWFYLLISCTSGVQINSFYVTIMENVYNHLGVNKTVIQSSIIQNIFAEIDCSVADKTIFTLQKWPNLIIIKIIQLLSNSLHDNVLL